MSNVTIETFGTIIVTIVTFGNIIIKTIVPYNESVSTNALSAREASYCDKVISFVYVKY